MLSHLLDLKGHELPESLVCTFMLKTECGDTSLPPTPAPWCCPCSAPRQRPTPVSSNKMYPLRPSCELSSFISALQRLGERPQPILQHTAFTSPLASLSPPLCLPPSAQQINPALVACRAASSASPKPWEQMISNHPRTLLP